MSDGVEIYKLSEFEDSRSPHTTITDDRVVTLPMKALDTEFVCPICLSLLHTTMTTKQCLHRFCAECITRSLRAGNKECPTCRQSCPSKRSLRLDPDFDAIIKHVYPDLDVYDQFQEQLLHNIKGFSNTKALFEEGVRRQNASQAKNRKSNQNVPTPSPSPPPLEVETVQVQMAPVVSRSSNWMHVSLKRAPTCEDLPELILAHLTVPKSTRAVHVLRYLADRLSDQHPQFCSKLTLKDYVLAAADMILPLEMSLEDLATQQPQGRTSLEMFYQRQPS
eukprot:m.144143 g.144143  ORF g.144143 m.144143 type:complete len:278 (+) comp30359_c0_seq5:69-902(+)